MRDSVGHIFRRAGAVFSGTVLSVIPGIVRYMLMGWAFVAPAPLPGLMVGVQLLVTFCSVFCLVLTVEALASIIMKR